MPLSSSFENNKRRVREALTPANRSLLDRILTLIDDNGAANLAEVLDALYPGETPPKAIKNYAHFREAIARVAHPRRIQFELETDRRTRTPHSERITWFKTESRPEQIAAESIVRPQLTGPGVATARVPAAGVQYPVSDEPARQPIRCFVIWAQSDEELRLRLMKGLHFMNHPRYRVHVTVDIEIPANGKPRRPAAKDLGRCDIGLILVTPALLSSRFAAIEGLKDLTGWKRAIPVALSPIPRPGAADLQGLDAAFRDAGGNTFAQQRLPEAQEQFVAQLFERMISVFAQRDEIPPFVLEATDKEWTPEWRKEMLLRADIDRDAIVDPKGARTSMWKAAARQSSPDPELRPDPELKEPALQFLTNWIEDPAAPPYCALLGEYGCGKTTTCKALTLDLLRRRDNGETVPFPLYLDLRNIGKDAKRGLSLEEILSLAIERNWKGGPARGKVTARELIELVEEQGAVVIWDGLDEVLAHLDTDAGQLFTRQLYRIVPPATAVNVNEENPTAAERMFPRGGKASSKQKTTAKPDPPIVRRLLISCRTHYFRTLREQKTHFLAEDRDNISAENYRAFLLLPFNEAQIREYIAHTLPTENTDRVMATLDAVHNLRELAERPYTLSLIAQQFAAIEKWKEEGRKVTGLTLYRHVALSWLERDNPKHQFTPDHKQLLMEHFAAELWRKGERFWSVAELEQWMIDFLEQHPQFAAHYTGKDRELLKEDLRTATFLVREGEENFRFAHTSLQEYFLAGYLRRALVEGKPELWALPRVSKETLDFLGQWLSEETGRSKDNALRSLCILRDGLIRQASELAFAYFLLAARKGYPNISGAGFKLTGADLREAEIRGTPGQPLALTGADFSGANLRNSLWRYCNLSGAQFGHVQAEHAEWLDCYLAESRWSAAELEGVVFRSSNLSRADFAGSRCLGTQFLLCRTGETNGLPALGAAAILSFHPPHDTAVGRTASGPGQRTRQYPLGLGAAAPCAVSGDSGERISISAGHEDAVSGCAFSPDGRRIVSASDDKTLRLWDAHTGESLLTLAGHEAYVTGCAFSPDGRRIVSASGDKTLRLWDAHTGESLLTLAGHEDSVWGCAFSPDGGRIVSASRDKTLRLWDAHTGESLLTLAGHEDSVSGCAFSPDGRRIVSASDDKTLRLWDAHTGESLLTLAGHEAYVTGCAFSPDGRRIVSASGDKTLRLWDAHTGESLLTLASHENAVLGCAFSPDGRRIVSVSWDKTLRLWDAHTGESLLTLAGHEDSVWGCAFSPDGGRIVSASRDKTLRLWDAHTGESLLTLAGHEDSVLGCAFSPDGGRIVSASDDKTLRLWDAHTGESLLTLVGHEDAVSGCAFSPDGRRIVSASWDKTLRLWDAHTGESLLTLAGHEAYVTGCAFSPDGRRIVSASLDKTLRLWDAQTGESLLTLVGHEDAVSGCAFSPDGRRIVSASADKTLRLWDAHTGESLLTLAGHEAYVSGCAFSPDGRRIVSASGDKTLRLWDAHTGESLLTLAGHEAYVTGCAFSPDGGRIVSASLDKTLRLWDAQTGESLLTLAGHEDSVWGCAFSPDGGRIVSASSDGSVRVWDAKNGEQLQPVMHHLKSLRGGPSWATIDYRNNRIVAMGEEAWRNVGYIIPGDDDRPPEWLPAETFPIRPVANTPDLPRV